MTYAITHENVFHDMTRLRDIRHAQGISLRALKKLSGVAVATLARIEAGGYDPRLSTLQRLAKALRVSVGELIRERPTRPRKT